MRRILFLLIGLIMVLVSSSSMVLTSDAMDDEPSISNIVGWGTRDRIIILWEVEGDTEQVTGFKIYRGIFPDDDSLMHNIESNGNYSSIRTFNNPNTRFFEDDFVDPSTSELKTIYIYKVVPLIGDLKSKGRGTIAQMIYTPGDRDNDGIPDGFELKFGLDPDNSSDAWEDSDRDGVNNYYEYLSGSNPLDRNSKPEYGGIYFKDWEDDLDKDGMDNDWEILYGLDPMDSSDAFEDLDYDGISNLHEYQNDTRPDVEEVAVISKTEENENGNTWLIFILSPLFILIAFSLIGNYRSKIKENEAGVQVK